MNIDLMDQLLERTIMSYYFFLLAPVYDLELTINTCISVQIDYHHKRLMAIVYPSFNLTTYVN